MAALFWFARRSNGGACNCNRNISSSWPGQATLCKHLSSCATSAETVCCFGVAPFGVWRRRWRRRCQNRCRYYANNSESYPVQSERLSKPNTCKPASRRTAGAQLRQARCRLNPTHHFGSPSHSKSSSLMQSKQQVAAAPAEHARWQATASSVYFWLAGLPANQTAASQTIRRPGSSIKALLTFVRWQFNTYCLLAGASAEEPQQVGEL